MFCNIKCRQAYHNSPERNPAKRPEVQKKISEGMKGHKRCVGRKLSEETKRKISKGLKGRKVPAEVIKKKVASWRKNAAKYGGMTPAHRKQLESIHKSGKDHPNWKGGTSPQRNKEFRDPRYVEFHRKVLERDDYTCQGCGVKNGMGGNIRLEVHHIKSYAENPELRFDDSNGLTLCFKCHKATRKGKPRPKRVDSPSTSFLAFPSPGPLL